MASWRLRFVILLLTCLVLPNAGCKRVGEPTPVDTPELPVPEVTKAAKSVPSYLTAWRIIGESRNHVEETVSVAAHRERRSAVIEQAPFTRVFSVPRHSSSVRFWYTAHNEEMRPCRLHLTASWDGASVESTVEIPRRDPSRWQAVTLEARRAAKTMTVTATSEDCGPGPVRVAISELTLEPATRVASGTNVLLIVLDTLRRDHLDCSPETASLAPNITRRLCRRGTFFEQAFSTSSWTYPALASMLSGQLPRAHGGMRLHGRGQFEVRRETVLLPEIMRWSGYRTAAVVANWQGGRGLWRGFDLFYEQHAYRQRGSREVRRAAAAVDRTIAWLEQRERGLPFFTWLLLIDLHEPLDAAVRHNGLPASCDGLEPVPFGWRGLKAGARGRVTPEQSAKMACHRDLYREAVSYIDAQVGRLLDYLEEQDLDRETAILLVSDHGEEFWDHKEIERSGGVGHGYTLYEEQVHVPLLVIPPRSRASVEPRRSDLVSVTDVFATALGFAGIAPPVGTTSRDLGSATRGEPLRPVPLVISETTMYGPDRYAVTTPLLRAIRTGKNRTSVFDRQRDPRDQRPLPNGSPLFGSGRDLLRQAFTPGRPAVGFSSDDLEALRALGYVE